MRTDLHLGDSAIELAISGSTFVYGSGMVTGGCLGDIYGHRRLFLIGMTGFSLSFLICGAGATPGQLVAGRMLQGLTGAMMVPQVLALITASFAPDERGRALAWFGATTGIASVAGQILRHAAQIDQQAPPKRASVAPVTPTRQQRVSDRLGADAVRQLVAAFQFGTSKRALAEHYGISESSVKRSSAAHPRVRVSLSERILNGHAAMSSCSW